MIDRNRTNLSRSNYHSRSGVVLLLTIVILVVLATLGYTLTSRLAIQRHRANYMIDYQSARYGCDSAIKYTLATMRRLEPHPVSRPNEPDFSDLFHLDEVEYEELLAEWETDEAFDVNSVAAEIDNDDFFASIESLSSISDFNDANSGAIFDFLANANFGDFNEPNQLEVRGPYGHEWPFISRPIEIETGSATVTIEIEDENAKYPVCWAMIDDPEYRRQAEAGFDGFCEWMDVSRPDVTKLKEQFDDLQEIKPFKIDMKPIKKREKVAGSKRSRSRRTRRSSRSRRRSQYKTRVIPVSQQVGDFVKLLHGSTIDFEVLARPTIVSETRKESALKYAGIWGCYTVNINSAPRHVLEAAFAFGGDEVAISEEIIQRRRVKPFKDIDDLKRAMLRYSVSIEQCEKFIVTKSDFFTIRITSVSGVARSWAIIAIMKEKNKLVPIAVVSG